MRWPALLLLSGCVSGTSPVDTGSRATLEPAPVTDASSERASASPRPGMPIELDVPLLSGDPQPLQALRGKVVVMLLSSTDRPGWSSFRRHCEARLRDLGRSRLAVVVVANDADVTGLRTDWDRDPPPFLLGWDPDGAVALRLGVATLPAAFVLDPEGRAVGTTSRLDDEALAQLDRWIDEALS